MALFKISKGLQANLPTTKTSGHCWYTIDNSMFYVDYEDENGEVQRQALNAKDAETLTGASLATILNSSDIEIPTSKAVLDALADAKTYVDNAVAQKTQVQMTTPDNGMEALQTLKIHKITKEQYEEELANGTIDENALYLTPDEEVDLSGYATIEQLNSKSDIGHNHDGLYLTEEEIDDKIAGKVDEDHSHTVADVSDLTVTAAELNYVSGATSNIQTQLDSKTQVQIMTWEADD